MTALLEQQPDPTGPAPRPGGALPRGLAWLLLGGGGVGLIAAFVLTVEKIALITDPAYQPSCSINPVLSCGSVMTTAQASVFGFPNSLVGIVGFAAVTTTGAVLLSGARLRGWYWAGLQVGVVFGAGLVHWLIGQSVYVIGALCPYCMAVWAVTMPIFWYVTLRNLDAVSDRLPAVARRGVTWLLSLHAIPLTVWYLAVLAIILQRFWGFWTSALP